MAGLLDGMKIFETAYGRMPGSLRSRLGLSVAGALAVSLSQIGVVGFVALLAAALSSPETLATTGRLAVVRAYLPDALFADPRSIVVFFAVMSAVAVVANNILRAAYAYWAVQVSKLIERHYSCELLEVLLRAPYEWHTGRKKSDVMSVLAWTNYYGAASSNMILVLCDILSLLLVAVAVVIVDPVIGGGGLLLVSLTGYGLALGGRRWLDASAERQRAWAISKARTTYMALMGVRDIKLFGQETRILARFSDQMREGVGINAELELVKPMPTYILETLGFVGISVAVVVMARKGVSTAYMAGTMALVAAAGWRLLPTVGKMLNSIGMLRVTVPYLRQVEDYHAEIAGCAEPSLYEGVEPVRGFERELRMADISFSYRSGGRTVLSGVGMRVPKGGVVGVVGSSGSGKSTLMDILCGLLVAGEGRLEIDGQTMGAEATRRWQVENVGYVSQSPFIFNGTLAENVAFSLDEGEIDRERVLDSCRMAAVDFLDDLAQGVDSVIGDAGVLLSGGQRQRVAIARALYRDPEVLIFDEATSSLDTRSEGAIQETILGLRGTRTLVIVAHRLSTVEACDVVYWIDRGVLRMAGSAAEVLAEYRRYLSDRAMEAGSVPVEL
ncbi:MAG: ABC transporter ATP-binding protein [Pseudodesulfovibrio sp.]